MRSPVGGEVPLSRLFAGPRKEKAGLYYYFSFFQIISSKRIPQVIIGTANFISTPSFFSRKISVLQVQCVPSQPHFLIHSRNTIPHPTHLIFDSFGTEQRAGPYPPLHTLPRPVRGNSAVCAKSGLSEPWPLWGGRVEGVLRGSIELKHSPAMPPTPSKDVGLVQPEKEAFATVDLLSRSVPAANNICHCVTVTSDRIREMASEIDLTTFLKKTFFKIIFFLALKCKIPLLLSVGIFIIIIIIIISSLAYLFFYYKWSQRSFTFSL
eukprot:gene7542-5321_t